MQKYLSKYQLIEAIQRFGKQAVEAKQVASRLAELFPRRFKALKMSLKSEGHKTPYLHKEYLKLVDEITTSKALAHKARIEWETHQMLLQARKSLESYARESIIHRKDLGP